jgi:hypothetical protein
MNRCIPDPRQATAFEFTACGYSPSNGEAQLRYRFDNGPELVERIRFPGAPSPPDASRQAAFERALRILHLIAGISYYKAGLGCKIRLRDASALRGLGDFLRELYVEGLGEFGHVNGIDPAGLITFPAEETSARPFTECPELSLADRALLALGGGKDSLVGLELAQAAGLEVLPVCVGSSALIGETAKAAGRPLLRIGRQLAPELAEMNRAGAWNGHVPVTAINSAILLCASLLYGYRFIVLSNERSADEPTLTTADGRALNHQYSKSSAFERAFRRVIATQVSRAIEYFSIVRPLSEVGIVQRFSSLTEFHPVYSSCNRNFHIDGPRVSARWCRDCPKCRFAALSLALFLSPGEVRAIQGGDLLNDPAQEAGYRALCRLGREKPFECVGEAGESRAALLALSDRSDWKDHAVVKSLRAELKQVASPTLNELLAPSGKHFIPRAVAARLAAAGILDGA